MKRTKVQMDEPKTGHRMEWQLKRTERGMWINKRRREIAKVWLENALSKTEVDCAMKTPWNSSCTADRNQWDGPSCKISGAGFLCPKKWTYWAWHRSGGTVGDAALERCHRYGGIGAVPSGWCRKSGVSSIRGGAETGISLTPALTPINIVPENYTSSAFWLDTGHNDKHNKRQ